MTFDQELDALEGSLGRLLQNDLISKTRQCVRRLRELTSSLYRTADGHFACEQVVLYCPNCGRSAVQTPDCCFCDQCTKPGSDSEPLPLPYCQVLTKPKESV